MKTFRAYLFSAVLLVLFVSAAAIQPAIGQTSGKSPQVRHQKIPAGKECSSCHKKTYAEWKSGPHGENEVQCTTCHGEVAGTVASKPSLSVCQDCHAELVAQLKSDPFMKEQRKTCVSCHPPHALKPHPKAASGGK
jgi:hypothetical protein